MLSSTMMTRKDIISGLSHNENKKMSAKLNTSLRGFKTGTTVEIRVDKDGIPKYK